MEFPTVTLVFVVSFILIVAVRIKRYFTHKREELEKSIYIHKKSGNSYIKLGSASEQIDGVWYTTKVVYKNNDGDLFIRGLDEWEEKFEQMYLPKEMTDKEEDYVNVNMSNCCGARITEHSRLCSKCLEHI